MAKLNHNRPTLRLLDNYRRELRLQLREHRGSEALYVMAKSIGDNRMPDVSQSAQAIIFSMFDAAGLYLEALSNLLKTLSPNARKSVRKKTVSCQKEIEDAKSNLTNPCVELVVEAVREKLEGKKSVIDWLIWFQDEA